MSRVGVGHSPDTVRRDVRYGPRMGFALVALLCVVSPIQAQIERAASEYGVPPPLLVSISYVDSRLEMNAPSPDGGYGLMHLIDLQQISLLSGISIERLKTDPLSNARGGAALLRSYADPMFAQYRDLDQRRLIDWWQAVMRMSGSSRASVANSYAAQVYRILRDGLPTLAPQDVRGVSSDISYDSTGQYCPSGACVAFVPANTGNYNTGRDESIGMVVIHDMEGTYSGSIAWFEDPAAAACAHYLIRSSDGQITQMVHDEDTAWHSGNHVVNNSSIGIEHEGFAHTGSTWYTEAMYQSSALLTRWITDSYSIPKDRTHIIGHYEVPDPDHAGWYGGANNHHDPCDSWNGNPTWHNNTACYWDWDHYMSLVVGGGPTGTLTGFVGDACCGIGAATRKPLVSATVTLAGTTYSTTTDSTGTYTFLLPAGSYTPRASMSGYTAGDHTSLGAGYPATLTVAAGATEWGSIVLAASSAAAVVKILSPADGAAIASSPVTVRGTVTASTIVTVNSVSAAVADGAFTATVPLTPGSNAIVATAGASIATIHVTYAPPQTGVAGHVTNAGAAVSNAGVSLGATKAVTASDGSYAISAAAGAYTLILDAPGFAEVSKQVAIPDGKVVVADFDLSNDSGPSTSHIRIDSPSENATVTLDSVLLSGVAEVPDLAALTVGAEQIAFDASGAFSVQVPLTEGPNTLTITATNGDGSKVTASVDVDYAPLALSRVGCSGFAPEWLSLLGLLATRKRKCR
jgi:hypothetical protein